jgi:uncharacterized protein YktB (UPF0637 family)
MATKKKDFWANLPAEIKQPIDKAKAELESGQVIPHEQMMVEMKKRVLKDVSEAVKELNLVKSGELKPRNAEDLFDEL